MGEAMSRRIRGVFNAANFWAIVLYNVLSLNSLEFAKLVGRRLIFKGRDQQRLSISCQLQSKNNTDRLSRDTILQRSYDFSVLFVAFFHIKE